MEDEVVATPNLRIKDKFFLNQYYLPQMVSNVSLFKKYYRIAMFQYLHLLLYNWPVWRRSYFFSMSFGVLNKNFYLLRCLNTRLLKVYNH
jgi:hypothetical protein